jgi:hypothetical protein
MSTLCCLSPRFGKEDICLFLVISPIPSLVKRRLTCGISVFIPQGEGGSIIYTFVYYFGNFVKREL